MEPPKTLNVDIHTAVKDGDLSKVQEFLDEKGDVNVRCRYQTIPLHRAAYYNREQIAVLLLDKGSDIETHDGLGHTPIFWACRAGHVGMIELLLSRGAYINAIDKRERTPLHEASFHGQREAVALLLRRGAKRDVMDVDANEPADGFSESVPESLREEIRALVESS